MAGVNGQSSFVAVQGDIKQEIPVLNPEMENQIGHLVTDEFRSATSFSGFRKKRMPRQRRMSMNTLPFPVFPASNVQPADNLIPSACGPVLKENGVKKVHMAPPFECDY